MKLRPLFGKAEFAEVGLRVDDGLVAVRGPRAVPEDRVRKRRRVREEKHRLREEHRGDVEELV